MACISRCVLKVRKMRLISYPPNNQKFTKNIAILALSRMSENCTAFSSTYESNYYKRLCISQYLRNTRKMRIVLYIPNNKMLTEGLAFFQSFRQFIGTTQTLSLRRYAY